MKLDLDIPQTSIIKGDQISKSISSASIIAKVSRDNLMKNQICFWKNKKPATIKCAFKSHMQGALPGISQRN